MLPPVVDGGAALSYPTLERCCTDRPIPTGMHPMPRTATQHANKGKFHWHAESGSKSEWIPLRGQAISGLSTGTLHCPATEIEPSSARQKSTGQVLVIIRHATATVAIVGLAAEVAIDGVAGQFGQLCAPLGFESLLEGPERREILRRRCTPVGPARHEVGMVFIERDATAPKADKEIAREREEDEGALLW